MMITPFNVLDPKQKVYGNFFLEASAGTGKTFTIAHLVVRLILDSHQPLSLTKIGVVTFTKAAAAELKKRIKELLQQTYKSLHDGKPLSFLPADLDLVEASHRLKMALCDVDTAPIVTLHSLCFEILQKQALYFNLPLAFVNPEESSLDSLAYNLIKKTLRDKRLDAFICKQQKRALLASKRGDLAQLVSSIKHKLLLGLKIEPITPWKELKIEFLHALQNLPPYPGKEALAQEIARYKLSPLTQEQVQDQLLSLDAVLEGSAPLESLLVKKHFLSLLQEEKLKIKAQPSSFEAKLFVQALIHQLLPLMEKALDSSAIELLITEFCKQEFDKKLQEEGILSFQSLLTTLDGLLHNQELIQKIAQDFEAMIIDEFQDTDKIQWSILKKLFIDQPVKAFYMVGDLKQAIYGFRAADVYTYMQAKQECPHLTLATLDTCFRSSAGFIEALNLFLSKAAWIELPYHQRTLGYNPVNSHHKTLIQEPPFHFYCLEKDLEETEKQMAQLAVFLKEKYPTQTIAILVKDRFQGERVETHLKQEGISYEAIKNETLDQSVVYELLTELLLLFEEPLTESSLNRFLSSKWFNLTLLDFKKDLPEKTALFQHLQQLKSSFEEEGFLVATHKLLELPVSQKPLSYQIAALYGPEILDKLYSVAAVILKKNHASLARALRLELELLKKAGYKLPLISRKGSQIVIMTSHMSKGLEFDHVIALGIATRFEGSSAILIKQQDSCHYIGLKKDDLESQRALHDLDAEKLRQQYVAITRAKHSLHIPLINYSDSPITLGSLSPLELYLLKSSHPALTHQELYTRSKETSFAALAQVIFHEKEFSHHSTLKSHSQKTMPLALEILDTNIELPLEAKKNILSFSTLKSVSHFVTIEDPLKGKEYGDFFHYLIERVLKSGQYQTFETQTTQDELAELISLSPFKSFTTEILQQLRNALNTPLQSKAGSFSLAQLPRENLYVEEAFSYQTEEGIMKGFIDCIALIQEEIIFIDWKTSLLLDTSQKGLYEHMEKASYLLQLNIYKKALLMQKSYFSGKTLIGAYYIFVKQKAVFYLPFEECLC